MARADALVAALTLLERPGVAIRLAQLSRLPEGVTFLLAIAAGEAPALREASEMTGRSEAILQKAAGFFIEQILLPPGRDSYRVLGGDRETSQSELRRHMALIMRWLHPDVVSNGASGSHLDRSLYANRVTQAWDSIKTDERRVAYNASLAAQESKPSRGGAESKFVTANAGRERHNSTAQWSETRRTKQLAIHRLEPEDFWSRLLWFWGGRR
jgi:hypothetical protein